MSFTEFYQKIQKHDFRKKKDRASNFLCNTCKNNNKDIEIEKNSKIRKFSNNFNFYIKPNFSKSTCYFYFLQFC